MGFNVGGIHVEVRPGVTQKAIAEFITDFWTRLGAKKCSRDPLSFETLNLAKSGDLGFAITPPAKAGTTEWVAIYDSERYRADPALARAIAKHFSCDVWFWQITDTANQAYAKRFGKKEREIRAYAKAFDVAQGLPWAVLYYDQLDDLPTSDIEGFVFLAFEGIPHRPKAKYAGPSQGQLQTNERLVVAETAAKERDAKTLVTLREDWSVYCDVIKPAVEGADVALPKDRAFVIALAEVLFKNKNSYCTILEAALREDDERLFAKALAAMPGYVLYTLEQRALEIGPTEPWIAFRLLEALTRTSRVELRVLNNCIYFLGKVFGQERLPAARIDALIEKAMAGAPTNPAIFHNLACVFVKRKDTSSALSCVESAIRYGYEDLDKLEGDDDLAILRGEPRYRVAFERRSMGAAGAISLEHLKLAKRNVVSIVPTIGLHLYFRGLEARKPAADLVEALHAEFPEMFAHCHPRGAIELVPTKKGRLVRTLKEMRDAKRRFCEAYFNAAKGGAACDQRVLVDLDAEWDGEVTVHLPVRLAEDPAALIERLLGWASTFPFVCGQAGYSLSVYYECNGTNVEEELLRLLGSHLGVTTSQKTQHLCPSTYALPNWITFVGPANAKKVKAGISRLRKKNLVRDLPKGAVAIVAAPAPFLGLVTAPRDLGELPAVVRALQPLLPQADGAHTYATVERKRFDRIAAL